MTTPPDPRAEARALIQGIDASLAMLDHGSLSANEEVVVAKVLVACRAVLEAALGREERKDSVIEAARKIPVNAGNWLRGAAFYEDLRDLEAALEMYDAARREEPKP